MKVDTHDAFDEARLALLTEHALREAEVLPQDRAFSALHGRFFRNDTVVTLRVSWQSDAAGLVTLSTHTNGAGITLLVQDSASGRQYHFPEGWFSGSSGAGISSLEVNAWSRFSTTPGGRPTGYKQQRFARTGELYFHGDRILKVNQQSTQGEHTGRMLYAALRESPDGVTLTVESC